MRKVAIFDIDGTVFRSSLLIELVEELIKEGLVPKKIAAGYLPAQEKWMERKGTYEAYIEAVVKAFRRHIPEVSPADLERVSKRVVALRGKRVYRYTRKLIAELTRKGYFLLAISNSPKITLDCFCRQWGFDLVYGRMYQMDADGKFANRIMHLDLIKDKAKILRRAVERHGLTLRGSVGVGDSESDIPFLKLVDHPICFNPNARLYAAARRRGWQVVVERKDVIYKI